MQAMRQTMMSHRSQSGRILLLGPGGFGRTGYGCLHVIEYHSCVILRVCRLALQAEALSTVAGSESAEHPCMVLHGLTTAGASKEDVIQAMGNRNQEDRDDDGL